MSKLLNSALAVSAVIACLMLTPASMANTEPATRESTEQALQAYFAENYAQDMARAPFTASYRGIKTQHDKWNSADEAHREESRAIAEARLKQLAEFDETLLSEPLQLSRDLYELSLQRRIANDEFRHHRFVIHQFRGPHTQVASSLVNIHRVADLADAQAYVGRLNNVGILFDQVIAQMRIRQSKNFLLADWQYPLTIQSARNIISGAPYEEGPADSILWADFKTKVAALDITDDAKHTLLENAKTALLSVVKPAYLRLIEELEKQAAVASSDDGVWKFENGADFYAQRLRWYTTTDLSAEDIHAIGLREVERIHRQMRDIMVQVNFTGTLQEFFTFMREDPQFYYSDTDKDRNAYLDKAIKLINSMSQRLPQFFGLLPQSPLEVKRVEAFRERSAGKAFYQGPPPDGSRPGIYYANLYDMNSMPKYQMEALAYHEGLPGHHLQLAIAAALEGIPEFQKFNGFTAYSEGWGLYSEQLAKEMGFYKDPYSDFGRLAMELWRACRLVVDTGIHSKRWTRAEAIDYLVANTPNAKADSIKAIERYIALPGQATAYMIGKLKIVELRERARKALGDAFDIRQFHDVVLKDGPVPLSLLEEKVDAMIAANSQGAIANVH